jgi:dTDP-4-dehydrorhamnose 3,5-epimerase
VQAKRDDDPPNGMRFHGTRLDGAFIIELDLIEDERGFFARRWCEREFSAHGLSGRVVQTNTSRSKRAGTIRGMHYQVPPHAEAKLVWCTRGAAQSVIIDLRPDSPTCGTWLAVELTAENSRMLYVPEGFAHGYQSLLDDTEVTYHTTEFYAPEAEGGIRPDDPGFGIVWPLPATEVSMKDRNWPDYERTEAAS